MVSLQQRAKQITAVLPNGYRAKVLKPLVQIPGAPDRLIIEKTSFLNLFNRQVAMLTVTSDNHLKVHFFDPITTLQKLAF
jgi:hypothetical protein